MRYQKLGLQHMDFERDGAQSSSLPQLLFYFSFLFSFVPTLLNFDSNPRILYPSSGPFLEGSPKRSTSSLPGKDPMLTYSILLTQGPLQPPNTAEGKTLQVLATALTLAKPSLQVIPTV